MQVYLAAPLFTTAERDFNAALAEHLRQAGHIVFVPQETELGADASDGPRTT